ncbi:hypothetical protein Tco_0506170, partial [Tanacetum coccineum]
MDHDLDNFYNNIPRHQGHRGNFAARDLTDENDDHRVATMVFRIVAIHDGQTLYELGEHDIEPQPRWLAHAKLTGYAERYSSLLDARGLTGRSVREVPDLHIKSSTPHGQCFGARDVNNKPNAARPAILGRSLLEVVDPEAPEVVVREAAEVVIGEVAEVVIGEAELVMGGETAEVVDMVLEAVAKEGNLNGLMKKPKVDVRLPEGFFDPIIRDKQVSSIGNGFWVNEKKKEVVSSL